MQVLKTKIATYLFDPGNSSLVLKERGKFSSVYIATRFEDKQKVVIKKLSADDDMRSSIRFQKECITGIDNENVPSLLDAWKDETGYYIIKEFIDGVTLRALSRQHVKNREQFFIRGIIEVCNALREFHYNNIFHCDLRPDNVMVVNSQRGNINFINPEIKILDFGLAKTPDTYIENQQSPFALIYSPPEQLLNYGKLINAQSDIYSLAVTLYECIVGDYAYKHINPEMIMQMQLNLPLKENGNISPAAFEVIKKATAKNVFRLPPSQLSEEEIIQTLQSGMQSRYATIDDFKVALESTLLSPKEKKKSIFSW
ncbi:MAG: serine/threonine protein kinase [Bacteroidetes bacterium]|nr:serine/threonine protein kinase [Bacteroidota bacterium]